jgi:cyclophilin family peptidyl-prolyl cis-trans isomerase
MRAQRRERTSQSCVTAALLGAMLSLAGCDVLVVEQRTVVEFDTTMGSFAFELRDDVAPATVAAFADRVASGFYDATVIHEVVSNGYIAIGGYIRGGLTEKPTGDPIALESGLPNRIGTVAMARGDEPDSATSRFFFNLADNAAFDSTDQQPGYAVFGDVVSGMDTIRAIGELATTQESEFTDLPVRDVLIRAAVRTPLPDPADGREGVLLETSLGDVLVSVNLADAPGTARNFLAYVDSGFYRGTVFHRAVQGFVVEGGGFVRAYEPTPAFDDIPNESLNGLRNVRESIAVASSTDRILDTSHIHVNLADNPQFDSQGSELGFPVFGAIASGRSALDAIAAVETSPRGDIAFAPVVDILITAARVYSVPAGIDPQPWDNADFAEAVNDSIDLGRDVIRTLIYYGISSPN